MTVHIDDLLYQVSQFQQACIKAIYRRKDIDEARAVFRAWCEENGLPIDFGSSK